MKRVVSVWLPDWPIMVWSKTVGADPSHASPEGAAPFALVERTGRGLVLSAVNAAARALGLERGRPHADARAMAPGLLSAPAQPDQDRAALRRLALWAERFSPHVVVDADHPGLEGLWLDMTGGAHLFGGEGPLLDEILARLAQAGILAKAALADTAGAAWALARYGERRIAPPGGTRDALADLPVQALRLEDEALSLLGRFGLRRIGDLYGLPRAGLARRFRGSEGLRLVRRLDQALGVEAEPLTPIRPPVLYRVWRVFAEPLTTAEGIAFVAPDLVQALAAQLEQDNRGARSVTLTAFRTDGRTTAIQAGLSAAGRRPDHLLRLLKEAGFDRLDLGFGADALMLTAAKTEPLIAAQTDAESPAQAAGDLAGLIDRLQARLGEGAVRRPVPVESHLPERSERWIAAGPAAPAAPTLATPRVRPLLLFDPPEPIEAVAELPDSAPARFVWRRASHRVLRAQGPERLSPEWWRPAPSPRLTRTRDYYAVEDEAGRRFWLFRDGLYEREDGVPHWWMHGVFA